MSATSSNCEPKTLENEFTAIIERVKHRINRCKTANKTNIVKYQPRYKYRGTSRKHNYLPVSSEDKKLYKADPVYKSGQIKKYCMLVSYSGANYNGCQRQHTRDPFTIEEQLLKVLLQHQWITPLDHRHTAQIEFARASRTDKGVSAVRQSVSLLLRKLAMSEKQRVRIRTPCLMEICSILLSVRDVNYDFAALNQDLPDDIRVYGMKRVTPTFDPRMIADGRSYSYTMPTVALTDHTDTVSMRDYRITAEKLHHAHDVLQIYKGVRNYHNFTIKVDHFERKAHRFMTKLEISEPFLHHNDIEFITIHIRGVSFMMHQIRKMMGAMLAVVRGVTDPSLFGRAFSKGTVDIPTAPGLGLLLEQVHYDKYNRKIGKMRDNHDHEELTWEEFDGPVNEFRRNFIIPTIVRGEIETRSMEDWLQALDWFTYATVPEEDIGTIRKYKGFRPTFYEPMAGKSVEENDIESEDSVAEPDKKRIVDLMIK